nr:MAG TPA: Avd-like protein [Caudoviricetes sp.]
MAVIVKAKCLMEHSFKMTANTKHFPKKYRFSIGARIENLAIEIYESLVRANETQGDERLTNQQNAIIACKVLNSMIELSYKTVQLAMNSVEYWGGLVVEVKRMTVAWRNSEIKRV